MKNLCSIELAALRRRRQWLSDIAGGLAFAAVIGVPVFYHLFFR
jgi:hypothetical protein